jgi:CHASE2 domain-containing sensor protein
MAIYWIGLIVGFAMAFFGGYLAWFKRKKLIGYSIFIVGIILVVLCIGKLPNWVSTVLDI